MNPQLLSSSGTSVFRALPRPCRFASNRHVVPSGLPRVPRTHRFGRTRSPLGPTLCRRLKQAGIVQVKELSDFDFSFNPKIPARNSWNWPQLASLPPIRAFC